MREIQVAFYTKPYYITFPVFTNLPDDFLIDPAKICFDKWLLKTSQTTRDYGAASFCKFIRSKGFLAYVKNPETIKN